MQLTYTSPTKVLIQVVLNDGETLGDLEGPLTSYLSVGGNPNYREILALGLAINDPLQIAAAPPPVNTTAPQASIVNGGTAVGAVFGCNPGTWNPSGIYTRQWMSGGAPIPGANNSTYTVQASDVGNNISCIVFCTNAGGSAQANSNSLGPITEPAARKRN